jgi:peptidoglycan biosynthesis protein MviN/MurJ (putative lipid II flippase)
MTKTIKYNLFHVSIAVSVATALLRVLGLLREVVLATSYGAGTASNAFVIAMNSSRCCVIAHK